MAPTPPTGFVTIHQALQHRSPTQLLSVIGVVVDFMPPMETWGTDLVMTLILQDISNFDEYQSDQGFTVKLFRKTVGAFPQVQAKGDVAIVRQLKVSEYRSTVTGLSNYSTECVVLPSAAIPNPTFKMAYANGNKNIPGMLMSGSRPATTEEQFYSIELRHAFPHLPTNAPNSAAATPAAVRSIPNPQTPAGAPPSTITPSKVTPGSAIGASRLDRQALLKDIAADKYYDPIGEVVKIQSASFDRVDIYLTDYTTNRLFYEYLSPEDEAKEAGLGYDGDPMNYINGKKKAPWPGPCGKMTLLVTLWLPHADWVRDNVHPGDYVCMKNVIVKYNEGSFSRLEGKLHQDRKYPFRVDVWKAKPDEPRVKDLVLRKKEYLARTKTANPGGKSESKPSKKQKRKEQRVKLLEEQQKKQKEPAESGIFFASNTHIRCQDLNRPLVGISKIWENSHLEYESPNGILQLPFINMKYRARVRVVDFWPDKLENFSQSLDSRAYNNCPDEPDSQDMMIDESPQPRGWEWFFYIWVMDATQPPGTRDPLCLKLLVAQDDAVFLLKENATDLRKDPKALALLREKLFVLWGNLEELKASGSDEMPTNTAFECCIKEYGVKVDDEYVRVHRLFGSTIM